MRVQMDVVCSGKLRKYVRTYYVRTCVNDLAQNICESR